MEKALILHAWFATPQDHWYQWLKNELESKGYEVRIPELKDSAKPTLKTWMESTLNDFDFDEESVVIGHSLGSALALNLAVENKFRKLVTVSGWDYWDLTPEHETFFNPRINQSQIVENVQERIAIHSDNDPYVTHFVAEEYAKRIDAKFVLLKGKGHFTKDDGVSEFPEILKYI